MMSASSLLIKTGRLSIEDYSENQDARPRITLLRPIIISNGIPGHRAGS